MAAVYKGLSTKGRLLDLPVDITQGKKGVTVTVTNTLAYYGEELITTVKSFTVPDQGVMG